MSLWRPFVRGLRALGNRKAAERDIAEEVESYMDQAAAEMRSRGLSPVEARRAARLHLGNAASVREQVRSSGWENAISAPLSDLRYAARRLGSNRGFTVAAVLTLALGIGASTAIFSVIEGVLLKPLPYPESGELVALRHTAPGIHLDDLNMAASLYFTYSEESRAFQNVAMWTADTASITGSGTPEEAPVLFVTRRFLAVLGVQPSIGAGFPDSDSDPRNDRIVMLSNGYWRSHFGGDPSILGRRILMDGDAREVVGVLPPSFEFMDVRFSMLAPFRLNRDNIRLISFCCQGIARMKPGVSLAQANADVARMLPMAPAKFPMNPGFSPRTFIDSRIAPRVKLLKDALLGDIGKTLWLLMGAVGIVLLIACANVANLLLVRADGRQHELALRAALGAGLGRIARELLLESLLLSLAGGAFGLGLAWGVLRFLAASGIEHLPRIHDIAIDPAVVAFTLCVSLGAGLIFGWIPVVKYAHPRLSNALRSGGRSLSQSRERHRARSVLVVVQVALALVLLVGSGLMIRTFRSLRRVDPGFSGARELETLYISIPESQVQDAVATVRMEQEILRRTAQIASVSATAIISTLPLDGGMNDPVYAEGQSAPPGALPPIRRYKFVSPGYFSAAGAHLLAGRDLTWTETYNQAPVALISANMARELWGEPRAAVGKRIRPTLKDDWREVIGVVADLRDDGVDQKAPGIVYWPLLRKNFESTPANVSRSVALVIRTPRAGSNALLQELQQVIGSVNANLPLANVKTLEAAFARSLARTSFTLVLLAIAGGMALLLGVVGIYGVVSYSVSQRTREIGIRLALGAPLPGVTRLFVWDALILSGVGAAVGLTAALGLTRLMKSVLFDVSPADPLTFITVSVLLVFAAALASYLPARHAARVNPVEALRAE